MIRGLFTISFCQFQYLFTLQCHTIVQHIRSDHTAVPFSQKTCLHISFHFKIYLTYNVQTIHMAFTSCFLAAKIMYTANKHTQSPDVASFPFILFSIRMTAYNCTRVPTHSQIQLHLHAYPNTKNVSTHGFSNTCVICLP